MKKEQIIAQAILEFNMSSGNIIEELNKLGNKIADRLSEQPKSVSEKMCEYCRKPSKPFYDSELKVEICPLCKAYWKSHTTLEIRKYISNRIWQLELQLDDPEVLDQKRIQCKLEAYQEMVSMNFKSPEFAHITEGEIEKEAEKRYTKTADFNMSDRKIWFGKSAFIAGAKWAISKGAKPEVVHCTQCGYHYDSLLKECPTCKGVKPMSEENRENIITEINNEIQPHAITLEHGEKATQAVYDLIYGKN